MKSLILLLILVGWLRADDLVKDTPDELALIFGNSTHTSYVFSYLDQPVVGGNRVPSVVVMNPTTGRPILLKLDSNLVPDFTNGTFLIDVNTLVPNLALDHNDITDWASEMASKMNTPIGTSAQYLRGDGTLATFPTSNSAFSNGAGYLVSSDLSPYLTSSSASATYATQSALTSGLAGKFNAPSGSTLQYLRGDGSAATFPTSNTAFTNGAGYLTSEVDGSITNEIELPTQTGQNGKVLSTNGTSAQWIASPSPTKSFSNPARSLNTAFQASTTQDVFVSYTVDVSATLTLTGGQTGTVTLQYADNSGMSTNLVSVQSSVNGNTGALTVGLSLTQTGTAAVTGIVPAGKWVRISTSNTAGTPTFTFRSAQEVAF